MANLQDVSIGLKKESVWGTAVTVDRWIEFLDESLDFARDVKQGQGLRVGNGGVPRLSRRVSPTKAGSGDITLELFSRGLGTTLEAAFGTASSNLVTTGMYQQIFKLGEATVPLTVQKGLVKADGTVSAYTFNGVCVNSVEISVAKGEIATLKLGTDIREVLTSTAYATPSYTTQGSLFHWGQAAMTIAGTVTAPTTNSLASGGTAVTNITDFSVAVNHNLAVDRYNMGGSGMKAKPTPGIRSISGSINVDYTDEVMREAFLADTTLPLVLTMTSTEAITGSNYATFQIYIPAAKLDGQLPRANAGNQINTSYTFTALDDGTNPPIQVSLRTGDTAL